MTTEKNHVYESGAINPKSTYSDHPHLKTNAFRNIDDVAKEKSDDLLMLIRQEYKDNPGFAKVVDANKARLARRTKLYDFLYYLIMALVCLFLVLLAFKANAECNKIYTKAGIGYKTALFVDYRVDWEL